MKKLIKYTLVALAFLMFIFSAKKAFSAVPWEQIPWEIDAVSNPTGGLQNSDGTFPNKEAYCEYKRANSGLSNPVLSLCRENWVNDTQMGVRVEVDFDGGGKWGNDFVLNKVATMECNDPNYPILENGKCNRGACPVINSQGNIVIVGGSPATDIEVQAGSQRCVRSGANGEYCVATAVTNDVGQHSYDSTNSSIAQSLGYAVPSNNGDRCGNLDATAENPDGTEATGTNDDVDYCYTAESSMFCYRDPSQVCPGGQCIPGCSMFGNESICMYTGGEVDENGNPADGGWPPIDSGGGSTGNGSGGGSGGDSGGGDPDDGSGSGGSGEDQDEDETTDIPTDIEPSDGLEGYYEKEYENGWEDVWSNNQAAFDNSAAMEYIRTWEITVSGAQPSWDMCVRLMGRNYGCVDLFAAIDSRVFPFIRLIIIISALILARQITLGG